MPSNEPEPILPATALNDQPETDDLGFSQYVDTLADLILKITPPSNIAIYGGHGSGKSTFMLLLEHTLKQRLANAPHQATQPVPIITFDPRNYPADLVGPRLIHDVVRALEEQLSVWQQIRLINRHNWLYYYQRIRWRLFPLLILALITELVVIQLMISPQIQLNLSVLLVLLSSSVVLSAVNLIRGGAQVVRNAFQAELASRAEVRPDFFRMAQFSPPLGPRQQAAQIISGLGRLFQDRKIVLFIDLSAGADKALEILEWATLLWESSIFIVVIAMDRKEVAAAIERQMGRDKDPSLVSGREVLERFVHLSFSIPRPSPGEWRKALEMLLWYWKVPTDQEGLSDLLAYLEPTPRAIKEFILTHEAASLLAARRGYGLDRDAHSRLIKWLVLGRRWPEIIHRIVQRLDQTGAPPLDPNLPVFHLLNEVEIVAGTGPGSLSETPPQSLLEAEPSIRIRDVAEFLKYTVPFLPQAAWDHAEN